MQSKLSPPLPPMPPPMAIPPPLPPSDDEIINNRSIDLQPLSQPQLLKPMLTVGQNVAVIGILADCPNLTIKQNAVEFANLLIDRPIFKCTNDEPEEGRKSDISSSPSRIQFYYDEKKNVVYLLATCNGSILDKSMVMTSNRTRTDVHMLLSNQVVSHAQNSLFLLSTCHLVFHVRSNHLFSIKLLKDARSLQVLKLRLLDLMFKKIAPKKNSLPNIYFQTPAQISYIVPVSSADIDKFTVVSKGNNSGSNKNKSPILAFCKGIENKIHALFRSLKDEGIVISGRIATNPITNIAEFGNSSSNTRRRDGQKYSGGSAAASSKNISPYLFQYDPSHSVIAVSNKLTKTTSSKLVDLIPLDYGGENDYSKFDLDSLLKAHLPPDEDEMGIVHARHVMNKYIDANNNDNLSLDFCTLSQWLRHSLNFCRTIFNQPTSHNLSFENTYSNSQKNIEEFQDLFYSHFDQPRFFAEQQYQKDIVLALAIYENYLPLRYSEAIHFYRIKEAIFHFEQNSGTLGPYFQTYLAQLKDRCQTIWENGRQSCSAISLTGKYCVLDMDHDDSKFHTIGNQSFLSCHCGDTVQAYEDPFDIKVLDGTSFLVLDCCSKKESLIQSLPSPSSNYIGEPMQKSFSFLKLGSFSQFSISNGISQEGFLTGYQILYPFECSITVTTTSKVNNNKKATNSTSSGKTYSLSRKKKKPTTLYLGMEYECSQVKGHRFILGVKQRNRNEQLYPSNDISLFNGCIECKHNVQAQLRRIYIATPGNIEASHLMLNPTVKYSFDASWENVWELPNPIEIPSNTISVFHLPYIFTKNGRSLAKDFAAANISHHPKMPGLVLSSGAIYVKQ